MKQQLTLTLGIVGCLVVVLAACSAGDSAPGTAEPAKATQIVKINEDVTLMPDEKSNAPTPGNKEICTDKNSGMSLAFDAALAIALSSPCVQEGQLSDVHICNENSGTWWIDLLADKAGCSPACVVDANTSTAEINWRCSGAVPPAGGEEVTAGKQPAPQTLPDYRGWGNYTNEKHGYAVKYPPGVTPVWDDESLAVTFEGPLVDDEHWPVFFIGHQTSDFYQPPEGVTVREWVQSHSGEANDDTAEAVEIAGLDAFHVVHNRSPQSYASDQYYFIKDGQLFSIVILHTGDKQDWRLYDQFLQSFVFEDRK